MKRSLLFFVMLFAVSSFAQETKDRQKISDTFDELDNGKLVIRFFDALTGKPIQSGTVSIESIGEYETDFEGRIYFESAEENAVLKVKFTHSKYITSQFDVEIMAGTLFFNRFSISPKMPLGSLRAVLDWSDSPRDLDLHLVKKNSYHISYRNLRVAADGTAKLDRDDTDGFGPETITTTNVDNSAEYLIFVHDFTNQNSSSSNSLSKSKGSVKIYGRDNELIDVFKVPEDESGTYWLVCKIVEGRVVLLNKISSSEN